MSNVIDQPFEKTGRNVQMFSHSSKNVNQIRETKCFMF
jgi:hypothetical protein